MQSDLHDERSLLPGNHGRPQPEQGVILILVAMLCVVIVGIVGLVMTLSYSDIVHSELEAAAEAAAHDAVNTFCTGQGRSCYRASVISALQAVDRSSIHGTFGASSSISLTSTISNLIAAMRSNSDIGGYNAAELLPGLRVTVQRGRWWPEGAPPWLISKVSRVGGRLYENNRFESFDEAATAGLSPGAPDFMTANAVRVVLERANVSVLYSPFAGPRTYDMTASAVAYIGEESQTECVAPFAVPVCALLDQFGEFNSTWNCHFDRYFTATNRYTPPTADARTFRAVPGAFFGPVDQIYCDVDLGVCDPSRGDCWQTLFPERCQCFRQTAGGSSSSSSTSTAGPTPVRPNCSDTFGFGYVKCNFNTWPTLTAASDQYGLVGLPAGAAFGGSGALSGAPPSETSWEEYIRRQILQSGSRPCVQASIGENFRILPGGLTQPATDAVLWRQISDQLDPTPDENHPSHMKTMDLGWEVSTGVVNRHRGFAGPGSPLRQFIEHLHDAGMMSDDDYRTSHIDPGQCRDEPTWGACNSHRYAYDERCEAWWDTYTVPSPKIPTGTPKVSPLSQYEPDAYLWPPYMFKYHSAGYPGFVSPGRGAGAAADRPGIDWFTSANIQKLPVFSTDPYQYPIVLPESYRAGFKSGPANFQYYGSFWQYWTEIFAPQLTYVFTPSQGAPQQTEFWNAWWNGFTSTPAQAFTCDTAPPQMSCPIPRHDDAGTGPLPAAERPFYTPENVKVWSIPVPVIADYDSGAGCTAVSSATADPDNEPLPDVSHDWRVIGFVRLHIYDNDIGKPPPRPPGTNTMPADWFTHTGSFTHPESPVQTNQRRLKGFLSSSGLLGSNLPGGDAYPPVCNYDTSAYRSTDTADYRPWGFSPEKDKAPQNCNMVRARTSCDLNIIGAPAKKSGARKAKIVA